LSTKKQILIDTFIEDSSCHLIAVIELRVHNKAYLFLQSLVGHYALDPRYSIMKVKPNISSPECALYKSVPVLHVVKSEKH
jgi:hypothetical protein